MQEISNSEISPLGKFMMGRLDDLGRIIVADFLSGRPYREPATIQSETEERKTKDHSPVEAATVG